MDIAAKHEISIVGTGRLGGALAIALAGKGYRIENLIAGNEEKAKRLAAKIKPGPEILSLPDLPPIHSKIVIIATPEQEIENVVRILSGKTSESAFIFHTSGSLSSEILRPLKENGCRIGSIHPLVSISDPVLGAKRFEGAYFCVEGDREAVQTAKSIVGDLAGNSFSIESKYKTLYHAAAVTACGHLVALVDVALEMFENCGLEAETAKKTLLPLIKSTIENLGTQTTAEALTGPFARADEPTFRRHLRALEENTSSEAREIYLQLGARSAHLAEKQGASRENLREILRQISIAKKNLKC